MNATANSGARQRYDERITRFAAERDRHARHSSRVSYARLATFMLTLVCLFWFAWPGLEGGPIAGAGAALFGLSFIALVAYHERVERRVRWYDLLRTVNAEGLRRLARDWSALAEPSAPVVSPEHSYAHDLDVVGHASLFHLLGGICSHHGRETLLDWLLSPAPPDEVTSRQAAVAELARLTDLRDELQVRGRLLSEAGTEIGARFLEWAEGEPWFTVKRWRIGVSYLLPALTVVLTTLNLLGITDRPLWLVPLVAGYFLTWRWSSSVTAILDRASPDTRVFREYPALFRLLHDAPLDAPALRRIRHTLEADGVPAHMELERLRRYTDLATVRLSTLSHFFAQTILLWDFHIVARLESWQRASGRRVRVWLAALGESEALAALAALRHDHAEWAMPGIEDSSRDRKAGSKDAGAMLRASGLAHPLLPSSVAVPNDVTIGPPGTFLLVTGSNMSGKSTLLRAIGLNAVLAQAGAPVCAREMRLPPLAVHTSIRVHDSLEQGVSYFMAELLRLKQVVDSARDAGSGLLYLLDEVLQGTNAAERQVAARRVIGLLLASGAIGAVTTHDLSLADVTVLTEAARTVHFSETVVDAPTGATMSFDFMLRPGIATSVNALRLMELIGLGPMGDGSWSGGAGEDSRPGGRPPPAGP